jgi:thiamine pyrophosphokinase
MDKGAIFMILDLAQFFDASHAPCDYTIIVLNQKIICKHLDSFFKRASLRICADGGWDQLSSWIEHNMVESNDYVPDYVIGDLDSVSKCIPDTTKVMKIVDQDRSDLQKCIDFVLSTGNCQNGVFLILGALGGRFDHELQALSLLYQYLGHRIIYVNEQSFVTLIGPGAIEINVNSSSLGPHCGFGPLRDRCVISTMGFEWNLTMSGINQKIKLNASYIV